MYCELQTYSGELVTEFVSKKLEYQDFSSWRQIYKYMNSLFEFMPSGGNRYRFYVA